jgi:hypothetical protein
MILPIALACIFTTIICHGLAFVEHGERVVPAFAGVLPMSDDLGAFKDFF